MSSHFLNAVLGAALAVVLHGVAAQPKPPAVKAVFTHRPFTQNHNASTPNRYATANGVRSHAIRTSKYNAAAAQIVNRSKIQTSAGKPNTRIA